MKPTLEELEKLDEITNLELKRVSLCLKHLICPECGLKIDSEYIPGKNRLFSSGSIEYECKSCNFKMIRKL